MKHKVGDKVRIKSIDWYNQNKGYKEYFSVDGVSFTTGMSEYCGKEATITEINECEEAFRINIDKGRFWYNEGMIEETPDSTSDTFQNIADTIRKIAEIIRKDNIGFSVKEENGEIIIKPIKVEKQLNDYPLDMPVMVSDDLKYWQLAYYYSRKSVYSSGKSSKDAPDSYSNYKYTIPFSQFDPKNIEESLKHNIVPKKLKQ